MAVGGQPNGLPLVDVVEVGLPRHCLKLGQKAAKPQPSAEILFSSSGRSSYHMEQNVSSPSLLARSIFTVLVTPAHLCTTSTLSGVPSNRSLSICRRFFLKTE